MKLTIDQKVQILCAALGGVIPLMKDQISANPKAIADQAVTVAIMTIAAAEKDGGFQAPSASA